MTALWKESAGFVEYIRILMASSCIGICGMTRGRMGKGDEGMTMESVFFYVVGRSACTHNR